MDSRNAIPRLRALATPIANAMADCVAGGLSIVPIDHRDKRPAGGLLPKGPDGRPTWLPFTQAIANANTLLAWASSDIEALAAVCGKVSGGLLILDFDVPEVFPKWRSAVGMLAKDLPVQQTGGGGYQVFLRCPNAGANAKLAWASDKNSPDGRTIAIETRGEHGYAVVPPSRHPSGGTYRMLSGTLAAIPTVPQETAEKLLAAARRLDETPERPPTQSTSTALGNWIRVSTATPCPICGKPDWCLISADGTAAICPRTEAGAVKDLGDAGYLHRLKATDLPYRGVRSFEVPMKSAPTNFKVLAKKYEAAATAEDLQRLARELGVSETSLRRLRVGMSDRHRAFSFPMSDSDGRIVGIRLRSFNGRKSSEAGGHQGLFISQRLGMPRMLIITEGPTDCAAALDLGFQAIGRPSCRGGVDEVCELVRRLRPRQVVIVADNDEIGRRGADELASAVALLVRTKVVAPPSEFKDLRAWRNSGVKRADVMGAIAGAADHAVELTTINCRGGGR